MLKLKKSLGQNFLVDKNIINKIISQLNLKNQIVLEIGAGSGNLTDAIIKEEIKKIFLIEKDNRFFSLLKKKYIKKDKIHIYNEDILNYDLKKINFNNVIVFGNLPYNISTQILVKFIILNTWPPFFKNLIFMFQKEVADRILAKSKTKEYGRLSILTNFRLEIINSFPISRNCFFPKPAVDSKIIVFKPRIKNIYNIQNIKNLEKITNTFFSSRRKIIKKPLSKIFKNYEDVAEQLKLNINLRPSELNNSDYYKLTECLEKFKA